MNTSVEHPVWLSREDLLHSCELQFKRSSGPGGQNRNKVETGVVLTFRSNGLKAEATERRNQGENKEVALSRLRVSLATQVRSPVSQQFEMVITRYRSKQGKLAISDTNWDWPIVLAELLNIAQAVEWNIAAVAEKFQTTSSQIVKLLKQAPQAFRLVNQGRATLGLGALKP